MTSTTRAIKITAKRINWEMALEDSKKAVEMEMKGNWNWDTEAEAFVNNYFDITAEEFKNKVVSYFTATQKTMGMVPILRWQVAHVASMLNQ